MGAGGCCADAVQGGVPIGAIVQAPTETRIRRKEELG